MLGKLIVYELIKKWKSSKFVLLGYVLIQIVIMFIIRMFLWNESIADGFFIESNGPQTGISASFVLLSVLFFILAMIIGAYPFVESIYRFERDLSGKQAYLELMIPTVAWKKVLSKLIATLVSLIICGILSLFSMFMYFMIHSNFQYFMDVFNLVIDAITSNGLNFVLLFLLILFGFASIYIMIFLCITIAKSFTHKNVVAVPIGVLAFVIISSVLSYAGMLVDKVPLYTFSFLKVELTLSLTLLNIVVSLLSLAGTSWLMEKRIEH